MFDIIQAVKNGMKLTEQQTVGKVFLLFEITILWFSVITVRM